VLLYLCGSCGAISADNSCSCKEDCLTTGDCCKDFTTTCSYTLLGSCVGKCGGQSTGDCWCDDGCVTKGDCCSDFSSSCGTSLVGSCAGTLCAGKTNSVNGNCYCDASCKDVGDCCLDREQVCGTITSRSG